MEQAYVPPEAGNQKADVSVLKYQKVGKRFLAIFIDTIILIFVLIVMTIFIGTNGARCNSSAWIGTTVNVNGVTKYYGLCGASAAIYFLIALGYFVLLEWLVGGTIGKLALGIRVRNQEGKKIGFGASLARNLMRVVGVMPVIVPYLVGAIAIWTSDNKQRLGDRVAKTVVIEKTRMGI